MGIVGRVVDAATTQTQKVREASSAFVHQGVDAASARAAAVKRWGAEKRSDLETWRYLRTHPSTAADPDTKEREDAFYQQAHAAVRRYKAIAKAETATALGNTRADRRQLWTVVHSVKANAKRALPPLIQSFETDIEHRSVDDVIAAASSVLESLEAHLKYAVPRVLHPADALKNLHKAMLEQ